MYLKSILQRLEQCHHLPGNEAFALLFPDRKIPNVQQAMQAKQAAVSMIIHEHKEQSHLALIKRVDGVSVHAAQMAFPGGKKESSDTDLLDCAIRETQEEIGVDLNAFRNQAFALSPIYIAPSNYLVQPYAFVLPELGSTELQASEVQELMHLPLHSILDENALVSKGIHLASGQKLSAKGYPYKQEFVWGATAAMITELCFILKQK